MGRLFRLFSVLKVLYCLVCAWNGNIITAQRVSRDTNNSVSQGHFSGQVYFYPRLTYPRDCEEVRQQCWFQNKSGVYSIKPDGFPIPFEVFCDNLETSSGGGWMTILRRFEGSVSTERTWDEYKHGFGFLGSEFWLGTDKISYVTNQKQYELTVDIVNSNGDSYNISYDNFRVSDEWNGYSISSVGDYRGTNDSFVASCERNMKFGVCACQGSCDQPEVRHVCNNNCLHGEGCFCPDGFLFKQSSCVPENECGCFVQGRGVIPNGEIYVNADCSSRCACNNDVLACENYGCSANANCEERNDVRMCFCNDGFEGDGQTCTTNGRDCFELYRTGNGSNGVYTIYPAGGSFQVYCDMTTEGGGWTVFQRRMDGGTNFFRNWISYEEGFGTLTGEFWLGNDKLHNITIQGDYQLRVDVRDFDGTSYYSLYSLFRVSNVADDYRLVNLGNFSGTAAGDAMGSCRNKRFSTYDNDNDDSSFNCAEKHKGGWWYGYQDGHHESNLYHHCFKWSTGSTHYWCSYTNPNGDYNGGKGVNVFWRSGTGHPCFIKFTEMKIRPVRSL